MNKKIIIGLLGVGILVGGGWYLLNRDGNNISLTKSDSENGGFLAQFNWVSKQDRAQLNELLKTFSKITPTEKTLPEAQVKNGEEYTLTYKKIRFTFPWKIISKKEEANHVNVKFEDDITIDLGEGLNLKEAVFAENPTAKPLYENVLGKSNFESNTALANYLLKLTSDAVTEKTPMQEARMKVALLVARDRMMLAGRADRIYGFENETGVSGFEYINEEAESHIIQFFDDQDIAYDLIMSKGVAEREVELMLASIESF